MSGGDLPPSEQLQMLRCTHHNVNTVVTDDWTLLFETEEEQTQVIFTNQDRVHPFPCRLSVTIIKAIIQNGLISMQSSRITPL